MNQRKNITRRNFFRYLIGGILSFEAIWLLLHSTGKKKSLHNDKLLFDAGAINSFQKNQIYPFTDKHFNLIRYKDGSFIALSNKCTHLGCVVNYNKDKNGFICPCHSSSFNLYGEVISSPADRPLDTYSIILKENHVWIDLKKAIKRQKFDKSQLYSPQNINE